MIYFFLKEKDMLVPIRPDREEEEKLKASAEALRKTAVDADLLDQLSKIRGL